MRSNRNHRAAWAILTAVLAGTVFGIPSCESVLTTFNPCGTIFGFCDENDINALFGDVPDWDLDSTCSIPYFGVDNPTLAGSCSTVTGYEYTPGPRAEGTQSGG